MMGIDLEHEVRTYAEYLDEVLPTVTADRVRTGIPDRPRPVAAHAPWYRRPVVVFLAAMVGVLAVAAAQLVLLDGSRTEVTVPPATAAPAPEVVTTVTTAPRPDTAEPDTITLLPTEVDPVQLSTVIGDIEFATWRFPPDQEFLPRGDLTSTTHGLVALDDGELSWSADYTTWHRTPIGVQAERVTIAGDDIVVSGATNATRFGWDGDAWAPQSQFELPFRIDRMVFGPRGAVAASATTIYYAPDGVTFSEAPRGPDLGVFIAAEDVPEEDRDFGDCRATFGATSAEIHTVLATDDGFVAFTSATHRYGEVCAPLLWFSADGSTWDLVSPESPFGQLSVVRDDEYPGLSIVERDGRFVAIGEFGGQGITDPEGAVWVSDNALAWQRTEVALARAGTLDAGELGWMLTGDAGEVEPAMWFSTDGSTWDGPYEMPEGLEGGWLTAPQFAVGPDTILAVGPLEQIHVIGRIRN